MAPGLSVKWHLRQIVSDKLIHLDTSGTLVGRSNSAKVCLRSNKTSRAHAQLTIDSNKNLKIFDLKSTNGTFVNGQQIPLSGKQVYSGDTVSFGLATIDLSEELLDKQCFFQATLMGKTKVLPEAADSTTNEPDNSIVPIEIDDSSDEFLTDKPSEAPRVISSSSGRVSARIASRILPVSLDRAPQQPMSRKVSTKLTESDNGNISLEIDADLLATKTPKLEEPEINTKDSCNLNTGCTKIMGNPNSVLPDKKATDQVEIIPKIESSPLLKSFSTNDSSNCLLIDLTNDDEDGDADISYSQIFQMSQIVQTTVPDYKYQQIKHELAEMDYCTEEVIVNMVPINLEDGETCFENTQDIWEVLEGGLEEINDKNDKNTQDKNSKGIPVSPEIDFSDNCPTNTFPSNSNSSTVSEPTVPEDASNSKEDSKSDKPKKRFDKPPIIEPHFLKPSTKSIKSNTKSLTTNINSSNKRKTSVESPIKIKKAKSNDVNIDKNDVKNIPKKRRSSLKQTVDKVAVDKAPVDKAQNIQENRRKKLKELTIPKDKSSENSSVDIPSSSMQKVNDDQKIGCPSAPVKTRIARSNSTKQTTGAIGKDNNGSIKIPASLPQPDFRAPLAVARVGYDLRRTKSSGEIKLERENSAQNMEKINPNSFRRSTGLINTQESKALNTNARQNLPPSTRMRQPMHAAVKAQYSASDGSNQDASRRLMWTNGGQARRPPIKLNFRKLPNVDDIVKQMVQWLPSWLLEQVDIDASPPINYPPATKIPQTFQDFGHYYQTFYKLILLESWQYLFSGFRETKEQPRKVKINHLRVANDLIILDCTCYITKNELKQELFYRPDDFVLLECAMRSGNNSYTSLNFGIIQNCKKTALTEASDVWVKRDLCGDPHTKLEFTMLTRYQPDKEMNVKKMPIIKVLSNLRTYFMLIRAVKGLANSPLCSLVLNPQISDYKIPTTHQSLKHKNELNLEQKCTVLKAASLCTGNKPGIYCIKGPPGTGKSTVIANLVFQILFSHYYGKEQLPMILLVAPSNTAIDTLLSKMMSLKRGESVEMQAKVKCVRIGPESSVSKNVQGYSLPRLAEKHMPLSHQGNANIWAKKQKGQSPLECLKNYFGDQYYHELKRCENIILGKSNIICTTLNSCINGRLMEAVNRGLLQFTCCIVDEATQCHEVEVLLPTLLGIDKFVLVGDPQQLSATIMNRDALKLGFGQSLFSRLANSFGADPRSPINMLSEQYRMHPEICSFPNRQFYEGKLRSVANPSNKLPEEIKPYLVFNLEYVNNSKEYTNMGEIMIIKQILSSIISLIGKRCNYTIGIITPYRAQKDLICDKIVDLETNNNCKIITNTVDSFQGSENDIIIISCVRESSNSFVQNECRLNVALTRAKQALYIVGNYTLFKDCRPLYDLREDAKRRKVLLDIKQNPNSIANFDRYLIKKRDNRNIVV